MIDGATFTLTDNQPGDSSATVGLIVDPSGIAVARAAPAPSLSFWGLVAAMLALLVIASVRLRGPLW